MAQPTSPFTPLQLFAFPLFSAAIAGFEERREPLRKHILDLRSRFPGVVRSNRNAWHSGDEFVRNPNEHVAWLINKVTKFSFAALAPRYDNWSKHELEFASCWANVLHGGGWNAPHHHLPCVWSGVVYVSVGSISHEVSDPSGMIEFINPNPNHSTIGQAGHFAYAPKDGQLLLFPSSLEHYVHPYRSEEERISIAFNLNVNQRPTPIISDPPTYETP